VTDPRRVLDVTDPMALRALAHPLRLRLLHLVRDQQPVTGARLAELAGESTASVSYHLSVLARHGFLEPDPAPGPTRRHKPWRTTFDAMRITSHEGPGRPPVETAEGALLASLLAQAREQQDAYLAGDAGVTDDWQDVGVFQLTRLTLTAAEVDRLAEEVQAVIDRYRPADAPGTPPDGRARFAVSFVAVPTAAPERNSAS
jgi:DNA-binding transcriptional ArsR family regulator